MEDKNLAEFDLVVLIDAIPAGEILDAIVAEKIMGWWHPSILDKNIQGYRFNEGLPSLGFPPNQKEREYKTIGGYAFWTVNGAVPIPKYSTDVSEAFRLLEHVKLHTAMQHIVPREACLRALRNAGITEVVIGSSLYK
jgi:hypothetical protein